MTKPQTGNPKGGHGDTTVPSASAPASYPAYITRLRGYMQSANKSQATVAKELDVSDGLISSFLAGKYQTPHTLYPKIDAIIKTNEKREARPKEPAFAETTVAKQVMNTIEYCHLLGKISLVYGDAGAGKTEAAKEYHRRNPETIMITVSPCYATITGVNELLGEELGIKEQISRRIFKETVKKLKGSGRVIIIDEAQHLTPRVINHLRAITDAARVGICFIGNWELHNRVYNGGRPEFAQLFSRIALPAKIECRSLTKTDIKSVFREAALSDESASLLHKIAVSSCGLRGAVNVFIKAIVAFGLKTYADLTPQVIGKTAQSMSV